MVGRFPAPVRDHAGLIATLVVLSFGFAILTPFFLSLQNLSNLLDSQASTAILVGGLATVMLAGSVDLSIGGIVSLSGVAVGALQQAGFPSYVVVAGGLATGLACGAVNAFLIVRIGIGALVGTLGTAFVFRGIAYIISGGEARVITDDFVIALGKGSMLGIPISVLSAIIVLGGIGLAVHYLRWGYHVRATGGGVISAGRSGVKTDQIVASTFLVSGVCAAFAGAQSAGFTGSAYPQAALGIELAAVAAIVIGGISFLSGSTGGLLGPALGVLLIGTMTNGFNLLSVPGAVQQVTLGLLVVGAVAYDANRTRRLEAV